MVVVRESPRAKVSPDKSAAAWPPKSPFEALLSSPSGRRKWQDVKTRSEERSPSPSPMRKLPDGRASSKALQALAGASDDEDEEDEETLQLRLQALQTKLKLKKLQSKNKTSEVEGPGSGNRASSKADGTRRSPTKTLSSSASVPNLRRPDVEVELSPAKERQPPVSPARARLGLNPERRGQDISLKRARDGSQMKRSDSTRSATGDRMDVHMPKPKSFNERLKEGALNEQDQRAKAERIERTQRKGFGSNDKSTFRTPQPPASKSRTAHRENAGRSLPLAHSKANDLRKEPSLSRSSSTRSAKSESISSRSQETERASSQSSFDMWQKHNPAPTEDDTELTLEPENVSQDSVGYDPFSELHLSKRHLPHTDVARAMSTSDIYPIPRLLKEVKAPHYDPPDIEGDFIVFAVLASKSTPFDQKPAHQTADKHRPQEDAQGPRNKFMVLHLTDLKWEIDCFLFGSAFDQFWKLTPGTLLALLNPSIMPPKTNQHNGRFCLKLSSSEDRVMEIGMARDLGYCVSVKKDGQQCGQWVDRRKTEVCEFHVNQLVERNRKERMEVNTMWRSHAGGGGEKPRGGKGAKGLSRQQKWEKSREVREYGQLYSVPSGLGKSASQLLDQEDTDALHSMTREEASRKRIATAQKERDLARKLGEMGSGVGAEYLRHKNHSSDASRAHGTRSKDMSAADAKALFDKPSASELGLLGKKASDQHLSPAKDRKKHFGLGAVSSAGSEAMGWGGAKKYGLLLPEKTRLGSPEKGQTRLDLPKKPSLVRGRSQDGSLSPKKRARYALEKGIREPGRESLGDDLGTNLAALGGDDDDELDIV